MSGELYIRKVITPLGEAILLRTKDGVLHEINPYEWTRLLNELADVELLKDACKSFVGRRGVWSFAVLHDHHHYSQSTAHSNSHHQAHDIQQKTWHAGWFS